MRKFFTLGLFVAMLCLVPTQSFGAWPTLDDTGVWIPADPDPEDPQEQHDAFEKLFDAFIEVQVAKTLYDTEKALYYVFKDDNDDIRAEYEDWAETFGFGNQDIVDKLNEAIGALGDSETQAYLARGYYWKARDFYISARIWYQQGEWQECEDDCALVWPELDRETPFEDDDFWDHYYLASDYVWDADSLNDEAETLLMDWIAEWMT